MDTTLLSSSRSSVQGIAGAAIGLSSILVIFHIVSRRLARASVWWDDSLLWLGGCMTLVMNALFIHGRSRSMFKTWNRVITIYTGAQLGLGAYEDQVSSSQLEGIFKVSTEYTMNHNTI